MTTESDLEFNRGNTTAVRWRLKTRDQKGNLVPLDLSGSIMRLIIKWRDTESLQKRSDDGTLLVDLPTAEITWQPTMQEANSLPTGRVATYKLDRIITGGEVKTCVRGYVNVDG